MKINICISFFLLFAFNGVLSQTTPGAEAPVTVTLPPPPTSPPPTSPPPPSPSPSPSPSPPPVSPPPVTPCNQGMFNPCGAGTCISSGATVRCLCPRFYTSTIRPNGSPFCRPTGLFNKYQVILPGDTCQLIANTFRITISELEANNPFLDCNNLLNGAMLEISEPKKVANCRTYYTVFPADTCSSIQSLFRIKSLRAKNPGLPCNNLVPYQSVCIQENRNRDKFFYCTRYSTVKAGSNCRSLSRDARISIIRLFLYNPGLLCSNLGSSPNRYCARAFGASKLSCAARVIVNDFDTCALIVSRYYKGSKRLFRNLNRGFVCDDSFLFVGQKLC